MSYQAHLRAAFTLLAILLTSAASLADGDMRGDAAQGAALRIIYGGGLNGNAEPCG